MRTIELSPLPPKGARVAIVVSEFNGVITEALLHGALAALEERDAAEVIVVRVPGALELPAAAQRIARAGVDAIVAVGAVILGETDHYQHVATQAMSGLAAVALQEEVPIGNAVLTVRAFEQARDRAMPGPSNKGYEAAAAVLTTCGVLAAVDGLAGKDHRSIGEPPASANA